MSVAAPQRGTVPAALGRFASSIATQDLPGEVVDKAKRNLLHDLSCALAGWPFREEIWPVARLGGSGHSTVIGEGSQVSAEVAAFANGALMHARSQDDTHLPARCHAGAAVIPAALAVAEREGGGGADFLAAVVAGYEVAIALGLAASEGMTKRGFRASGVLAPIAAAAACARAMQLGPQQAADAIAIACSFAAGLSQTWIDGTTEYRWELALGARNGVLAADLAASGSGGAPGAFEGAAGLGVAFAGSARVFDELEIGAQWRILEVIYKPQPVCNLLQTHVELAASLAADAQIDPGEVDSVK
jgi:2-methylcitrate dehydratase PrpD